MKFDKFLQGVIFLIISITSVSIIVISSVLSDIDDTAELDAVMNSYAQQKTKMLVEEIYQTHLELDIIALYVSQNLSDDTVSHNNLNFLYNESVILLLEKFAATHGTIDNIMIFQKNSNFLKMGKY
jgi:hypothetical protein